MQNVISGPLLVAQAIEAEPVGAPSQERSKTPQTIANPVFTATILGPAGPALFCSASVLPERGETRREYDRTVAKSPQVPGNARNGRILPCLTVRKRVIYLQPKGTPSFADG